MKKYKNPCRIPGHDHKWSDYPRNRNKKNKENNRIELDSSESESSSD